MLDVIKAVAIEALGISAREVAETRAKLREEYVQDEARHACRTALEHPEGSTTWFTDAAEAAQQTYARVRKNNQAQIAKVLGLVLAMEVARERRDESEAARVRRRESEAERLDTGVHKDTAAFFARIFGRGVSPTNLKNLSEEEIAIIADLIRWKVKDPRRGEADNPWNAVFGAYAGRLLVKSGRTSVNVNARSVPGVPTPPISRNDPTYYIFANLTAAPTHSVAVRAVPVASDAVSASMPLTEVKISVDLKPSVTEMPPAEIDVAVPRSESRDDAETSTLPVNANTEDVSGGQAITPERAREMADAIYAKNPIKLGIYWPLEWVDREDYAPERLVPALERWVATGKAWTGAEQFLDAARLGQAREFMERVRSRGVAWLTADLLKGEESALKQARSVGFDI